MKALRMQEACSAGKVLGVEEEQICFLEIPNGELKQQHHNAQKQVEAILSEIQPQEVYIPSPWDFHYEHRETALIVLAAVARLKADRLLRSAPLVYEYPIWFWHQWPLVGLSNANAEERSRLLKRGLRYGFGMALITQFRTAVSVRDVLEQKRDALEQYVSQTTHFNQDPDWATLQDVAGGEFIKFFFLDCEVFRLVKGA